MREGALKNIVRHFRNSLEHRKHKGCDVGSWGGRRLEFGRFSHRDGAQGRDDRAARGSQHCLRSGRAVVCIANLPLDTNVLFMTIMANGMPFVGRG